MLNNFFQRFSISMITYRNSKLFTVQIEQLQGVVRHFLVICKNEKSRLINHK